MNRNLFNSIKLTKPKKSTFDLSHDVKLSCDMGWLVPTLCMDVVPSDSVNLGCESLVRFAPLIAPVMHRLDVYMHYFFVPNRIVWDGWEDFISNNVNIAPSVRSAPLVNVTDVNGAEGSLADYLGIPPPTAPVSQDVSAIPFAAYTRIYNEYYRDQNLQVEIPGTDLVDGLSNSMANIGVLRRRAWEHDYFTAALPFAQKGPAISLPIAGFTDVPVRLNLTSVGEGATTSWSATNAAGSQNITADNIVSENADIDPEQLYADTSEMSITSSTVQDLRTAFQLQKWAELIARTGTRYKELIFGAFGVNAGDARLDRPEYITGTKSPVIISEVVSTAQFEGTESGLPQGNMAGHGVSVTSGKYGHYFVKEHGYIIGIMSVMPKTAYQDGIARHWRKFDYLDYFWKEFAHLGEQQIYEYEVNAQASATTDPWGYVPRYSEYKYMPSRVAGEFRTSLAFWHLGRQFGAVLPELNEEFVQCEPSDRIFAVNEGHHLWCHVFHRIKAVRPMPKYGNPGGI